MARRSDHTRDELHALILGAAGVIVEREGAAALTIRRIADAIGYSSGTLYNLFKDIDDIVVHLNAATLDELHGALTAVPPGREGEATILSLAGCYLRFARNRPHAWRMLFQNLPSGRSRPVWYYRRMDRLFVPVEDALRPMLADGRAAERRRSARVLWAGIHGICSLASDEAVLGWGDVDAMAESLIRNYVAGLRDKRRVSRRNQRLIAGKGKKVRAGRGNAPLESQGK